MSDPRREDGWRWPIMRMDRSPMQGRKRVNYTVIGEGDVAAFAMPTNAVVLSVHSPSNYPMPWPQAKPSQVLHLEMHDVTAACEVGTCRTLTQTQAEEVEAFLESWLNGYDIPSFVFQCEAGVSRSAGLCQAVAEWFGDDEVVRECFRRYSPNQTVRERLYRALTGKAPSVDWEADRG